MGTEKERTQIVTTIDRSSVSHPTLTGRSLVVARIAWVASAALALAIFASSLPGYVSLVQAGWNPSDAIVLAPAAVLTISVILRLAFSLLASIVSLVMAGILFWRAGRSLMAVYTSLFLLGFGIIITGPLETAALLLPRSYVSELEIAWGVYAALATSVLFWMFPNGRFVPTWTRHLILPSLTIATVMVVTGNFPVSGSVLPPTPLEIAAVLVFALLWFGGFAAQVFRYLRISSNSERQQTKWVLIGTVLWIVVTSIASIGYSTSPDDPITTWRALASTLWFLAMCIIPVSLTVSILRYRLWDVDVIIRRTLTYGSITLLLGLTYFGAVALLQNVFVSLTGQQSPLAVVASTLGIAALFNPLRNRVQAFVDRRFYRRKYDAEHTLEAFAESLRDEVDIEHLEAALIGVVEETMQPEGIGLWLAPARPDSRFGTGGRTP